MKFVHCLCPCGHDVYIKSSTHLCSQQAPLAVQTSTLSFTACTIAGDVFMQMNLVDDVVLVSTEEAEAQAREAALTKGLLVCIPPQWLRLLLCPCCLILSHHGQKQVSSIAAHWIV
jgi:hypothetical protein